MAWNKVDSTSSFRIKSAVPSAANRPVMQQAGARVFLGACLLLVFVGFGLKASPPGSHQMTAAQTPASAVPPASQESSPSAAPITPQPPSPAPSGSQIPGPPPFFVMIDPGHGGHDPGATFAGKLIEKDITLALARRLKSELHEKGILARLLRDSDVTVSLEQRAENTNEQHAAVYVALHAGMPGEGVRVYAPALASLGPPASATFVDWDRAQANSLSRSQELAQKITSELSKRGLSANSLSTPLRPLNNIVPPAVAVELAPDPQDLQGIMGQKFQTTVAAGIVAAIVQLRPGWEGRQ